MTSTPGWMVRTQKNQITGLFTEDQLKQKILGGELSDQDEICSGNHYWIYLYEKAELMKQLGIEFPKEHESRPVLNTEAAFEEITEDVPHTQAGATSTPSSTPKPAPLAPRLHREDDDTAEHTQVPEKSSMSLPKLLLLIAAALVIWFLISK